MASPILVRRAQVGLKQARRLSVSDTKPSDTSGRPQPPSRSHSTSKKLGGGQERSFLTDSSQAAISPDKSASTSRGMATITPMPTTATVVGLQPKCTVTNTDGLSVKPSPIVTFDGAGPFSSPCVGLDLTVAARPSTDAVALKYRFRSPPQAESDHMPLVDVPLTSHQDWTRVRMGATELEYQSSPLRDGSSATKRAVVRTKMTTTSPSLSSVKVHSVFIVQSQEGSGPQVQHVLPSHPLFHDN